MPHMINIEHDEVIDLETCIERLNDKGFNPNDETSVYHAASQLKALHNNRNFLTNIIIKELQNHCKGQDNNVYSGQSIMLHNGNNGFAIRANIWPGKDHYLMRSNGDNAFYFDMPHDHNFDFLTIGYLGPGYWSEYYEYNYEEVTGYVGEPVDLKYIETSRLEEGKILFYRAHKDVHHQLPADSLSVSLNIMHQSPDQPWYDQYHFDLKKKQVAKIINHISSEVLLHMAVNLIPQEGQALAREYAKEHPSDRMRVSAWNALYSAVDTMEDKLNLIESAVYNDSILLQKNAKNIVQKIDI